jgi:hypothetical protein
MSNAYNFAPDPNVARDIPLSLILVDRKWNSRSSIAGSGGADGNEGYIGTLKSIATKGQTTPGTVMLNLDPETSKDKPYFLVTGFTRFDARRDLAAGLQPEAIKELVADGTITDTQAAGLLTERPTFRAIVKKLTWKEARIENLEENVRRDQLSQQDIAWGVTDLAKLDPTMKHHEIGALLGVSQGHVSMAIRVMQNLAKVKLPPKSITADQDKPIRMIDHWRTSTVKLPYKEMDAIQKLPTEDEQIKAYLAKVTTKASGNTASGLTAGRNANVDNAIGVHSKTMGKLFGSLSRQGVIAITGELFSTAFIDEVLLPLTKLGSKTTDDDRAEMALNFRKAFDEAKAFVPPTTTKEEDDAAAKAAKDAEAAAKAAAAPPATPANGAANKKEKGSKKGGRGAHA